MKKIITSMLLLAIASASFQKSEAQTNTFPATGNVGIGTTTPTSKLEILPVNGNALTIRPYGTLANSTGQLQFRELAANGTNYVGLRAPDALAASLVFRLPTVYGTSGQVLSTTGSGVLTWVSLTSVTGANNALSNLTTTSINQALLPSTTNARDLGSASRAWRTTYTTGVYPRTGGTLGFGIATGGALATFADQNMTSIATNPSLQIGATTTYNLALDNHEIQARNNGVGSDLYFNYWGGSTHIGSNVPSAYTEVINPIYMNKDASVYGRLGIKTTTPAHDLEIVSTDYTAALIQSPYIDGTTLIVNANATSGASWAISGSAPTSGYAGYFSGNVYCTASYLPSDERLKENIVPMQNALEKIMKMEVKTYNFKQGLEKMNLPSEKQNGFIAQNLATVFPELVKLNPSKKEQPIEFKAVNYIGMIPVLTEAMQEQNHMIENLKTENDQLHARLDQFEKALQGCCINYVPAEKTAQQTVNKAVQLKQNIPNPFNKSTVIEYFIPENYTNATLKIYSSQGVEIKQYSIKQSGKGEITVEANTLAAGIYSYTLIVDNEAADVKQMIVTK